MMQIIRTKLQVDILVLESIPIRAAISNNYSEKLSRATTMTIEHHDLLHEFPQLRDQIHELKTSDRHFRKLFDEYHDLTKDIEKMEAEINPVSTRTEEDAKMRRVQLKDQLYKMLCA